MMSFGRAARAIVVCLVILSPSGAWAETIGGGEDHQPVGPASLYEVTERVVFDAPNGVILRSAVASLMGFARLGTPLCLTGALVTDQDAGLCTVIGVGQDHVSTATGLGPVSGIFSVVVNAPGNSAVHVPDLPILVGTFQGAIDLSPAVVHGVPLGSVTGTFTIYATQPGTGQAKTDDQGNLLPPIAVAPFSGTFRLPFALDVHGNPKRAEEGEDVFYLGDSGQLLPVMPTERSLGYPAVRLDIQFGS